MISGQPAQAFVLQENSEWLRYVFLSGAVGMCFLVAHIINAPVLEGFKLYGSIMGVLLLGFCGFGLKVRRVTVDPVNQEIVISIKGFRNFSIERIKFHEVNKILVLMTPGTYEDSNGRTRSCEDWSIALAVNQGSVSINQNPYSTKAQALDVARKIQQLVRTEISDSEAEGISHLAQSGRKVEAIALARRTHGLTIAQAKDLVERNDG